MALIRPALLAALVYLAFLVAYPDWTGAAYHVMAAACAAGGVVGVWLFGRFLDVSDLRRQLLLEAAFAAVLALVLGYTMPLRGGTTPLAGGSRPSKSGARRGLERLGLNPYGALGDAVAALFPAG